jgi:hypothetical protein
MQMFAAGMIEQLSFSLFLSYAGLAHYSVFPPSNVLFGGSDLQTYSIDQTFTYIPLVDNADGWVTPLSSISIDGIAQDFIADRVRFTTSTFLMLIPRQYYLSFASALINITSCGVFPSGYVNCPCPEYTQFEHTLTFRMGNVTLEIPPAAYFYQVNTNQVEDICYFFIGVNNASEVLLGTLFQTQFYMDYDYTGQRVGLARAAFSIPIVQPSSSGLKWWGWLMGSFLIVCTVCFFVLLCRILRPKRGRKKRKHTSDEGEMLRTVVPSEAASPEIAAG